MIEFKSKEFRKEKKARLLMVNQYANQSYGILFTILLVIIFVLLVRKESLFWISIIGSFLVLLFSQAAGVLKMKKEIIQVNISGNFYCLVSMYDVVFKKEVAYQPIAHCNFFYEKNGLQLNFGPEYYNLQKDNFVEMAYLIDVFRSGGEEPLVENMDGVE